MGIIIDTCFECPVCKKLASTSGGHLVCDDCYLKTEQEKYDAEQTAKFNAEESNLHNPTMRGWK